MDYLEIIKKMEQETEPRTSQQWLVAWRELAEVTSGITGDDPRLERIMRWLDVCEVADLMDCWPEFCAGAEQLKEIMRGRA